MGQSRRRFRLRNEPAREEDQQLTASQKRGVIKQADFVESEGRRVVEVVKGQDILKHVEPGDFVISMRSFQGGLEYSRIRGSISSAYVMLAPIKDVVPEFFSWLFKSQPYIQALQSTTNLVRDGQALRFSNFCQVDIPLIPADEQLAIATFLDRETAKIDALITEQQRLIELLQEKRQAVISHAVTKGLNPDAPMKDSGVEWLGEVPEHWSVAPLKQLINRGSSISYGIVQPGEPREEGVPFVQTTNMSQGDFSLDNLQKTTPDIASSYPRSSLTGGEVLLGIRASIGAAHIAPHWLRGANLSRGVARIVPGPLILNGFLVFYLRSEATCKYWLLAKQGSTFNEVSIDTVKNLKVCVPPIHEQESIACYAQETCSRYDESLLQSRVLIALLQERRSALISAAVTGQIDVRGPVPEADQPLGLQPPTTAANI